MPTSSQGLGQFSSVIDTTSLSDDFADNQVVVNTHGSETAVIYVDYTAGSESSVQVQVELWDAVEGWSVEPYDREPFSINLSMDNNAQKRWMIRRIGRFEQRMRISAKANTATTDTDLVVQLQFGSSRFPISGNVSTAN